MDEPKLKEPQPEKMVLLVVPESYLGPAHEMWGRSAFTVEAIGRRKFHVRKDLAGPLGKVGPKKLVKLINLALNRPQDK